MQDFRKLHVWERAHALTLEIYRETRGFPDQENFGLTSQLRRACSSIAANIAEGCGRNSAKEKARFFSIAMGSASEVQYHLLLAKDLNYFSDSRYRELETQATEVKKMLSALTKKLKTDY